MIDLVKREDYLSEEEYEEAYENMLKAIKQHDIDNPEDEYDPNYEEEHPRERTSHYKKWQCSSSREYHT